ncbi:MAG: WD40 repeat domain-containing protein [Anaerolineales bacterium]
MNKNKSILWLLIVAALLISSCGPADATVSPKPTSPEPEPTRETAQTSGSSPDQISLHLTFSAHEGRVLDLAFSSGSEYLASSGRDLAIKLWDPATGKALGSFPMKSVDMSDIDISQQENLLASGEAVWDLETGQEVLTLMRGSVLPAFVAFSPDGGTLALAPLEEETRLWDLAAGEPAYYFPEMEEPRTKRMEYSPDGLTLAEGVIDGSIRIWGVESGELIRTLHYSGEHDIHDIGFSPDGKYLASVGQYNRVVVWDISTGEAIQAFRTRDNMNGVSFSGDGRILAASAGAEKAVLLWDLETGGSLGTLPLQDQSMAMTFSPDGKWLAAGTFGGEIFIWEISPAE